VGKKKGGPFQRQYQTKNQLPEKKRKGRAGLSLSVRPYEKLLYPKNTINKQGGPMKGVSTKKAMERRRKGENPPKSGKVVSGKVPTGEGEKAAIKGGKT